eukprot:COSAG02_NODE_2546_length_8564_cov_4.198346_1_plen_88_part_00
MKTVGSYNYYRIYRTIHRYSRYSCTEIGIPLRVRRVLCGPSPGTSTFSLQFSDVWCVLVEGSWTFGDEHWIPVPDFGRNRDDLITSY